MVNKNELLYVVDEFDVPQTPVARHLAFKKGLFRRCVHVWIINQKKQILCQKRSHKKDISPGMWEPIIGGHIGPDDNYYTGAVREVREETGLSIKVTDLNFVKIYKDHMTKEYRGVFYWKTEAEEHHIIKEEDEVEEVKMININTLKKYLLYQKSENWIKYGYEKEMFSILKN